MPQNDDEATREKMTARIYNMLTGWQAEPVNRFEELEIELDGNFPDELEKWKATDNDLRGLRGDVFAALAELLWRCEETDSDGYRSAMVFAARVALQRGQTEMARDLLVNADITNRKALEASGAEAGDIFECQPLFVGGRWDHQSIWQSMQRTTPSHLRNRFRYEPDDDAGCGGHSAS